MSRVCLYVALLTALVLGVPLASAAPPPTPTIDTHPETTTSSTGASFTFHVDPADPTLSFQCQVDGSVFSACKAAYGPADYLAPLEGPHTFGVKAVDAMTQESGVASWPWTIDTQPPALMVTKKPADLSDVAAAHFEFAAKDETSVAFQCQLDDGAFQSCSTPPGKDYSGLKDAAHTFALKGTDAAGNESTTSFPWLVDTAKPIMTITSAPRNPTNQTGASFSFSSNRKGSEFRCKLDGGGFSDCKSPKTYGALGEGTHTFSVKASASAPTTSFSWTIDLTPPPVPSISGHPTDPSTTPNASFNFSDGEAGVSFGCQVDGGGFRACASPATYSGLGAGSHAFAVRATDPAGNTGTTAVYGWTVKDATAPANVQGLKRTVGYRTLKLTWSRPPDADFSYVRVFVAKGSKAAKGGPLRTSVYKGTGTRYMNKRFNNGTYYRYAIVSYDKAGNASRGMPVVVRPSALLRSPAAGRVVHTAPRLVWARVAKASFYNVQLFFRGQKVLSAWPSAAKLGLKRSWSYANRGFKLKKGTYVWYVWPGFGARAKSRYGQLLGQSVFTVR